MKTNFSLILLMVSCFLFADISSSCTKNADSGGTDHTIQQGDSTIEILAIYTTTISSNLLIKFNNVIDASINGTVTFHLKNGQTHDVPFSIPAGYKNLESWGSNKYLNVWSYINYYDSTSGGMPSAGIDGSWEVDFVEITAVKCTDKTFGFNLIKPSDDWTYYHPTDPVTSVSFVSNLDTVSFSNYTFNTSASGFYVASSTYAFYFRGIFLQMFSTASTYPLKAGQVLNIPFVSYYWNSRNYGSQLNPSDTAFNGSTVKLKITKVTDKYFDASFSGKIWSTREPDTLLISNGKIENALLPIRLQ